MAENLIKIRRRIASINSTKKITNAMELVSSAKLRKKKKLFDNVIEYSSLVEQIVFDCLNNLELKKEDEVYKLINLNSEVKSKLYVVVTSNLGLCGGYNFNVIKHLNSLLDENDEVILLGSKGLSKIDSNKNIKIDTSNLDMLSSIEFSKINKLITSLKTSYINKKYNSIYLIYTSYKNALTFIPTTFQIFPYVSNQGELNTIGYSPIYCPSRQDVVNLLIPKYLNSVVYKKVIESSLAEEASRRIAMENATDNADDLNKQLQLVYNKARQAAITSEINDIMVGRLNETDD